MRHVGRSQLGKEDVLTALDKFAVNHHATAHAGLPEGQIENVVKPEGNKRTFNDTEDERTHITRAGNKTAELKDNVLRNRPNEGHGNTDEHENNRRNNGDKARAAEEAQGIGEHNLMILVMKPGYADTDDDTAEHTHLQRGDAAAVGDGTFKNAGGDRAVG